MVGADKWAIISWKRDEISLEALHQSAKRQEVVAVASSSSSQGSPVKVENPPSPGSTPSNTAETQQVTREKKRKALEI